MTISKGSNILQGGDDFNVKIVRNGTVSDEPISKVFKGRKVAVLGLPGAFTGVCTASHLPGFIQNAEKLKAKGADEVICITVNDPEVSKAWADHVNTGDKVSIIADWDGSLTRLLDQEIDLSVAGLGKRCKRFSGFIDDGNVKDIETEDNPGQVTVSSADSLIERL